MTDTLTHAPGAVTLRQIPGLPGYCADSLGNIWSVGSNWRNKGPRIMRPTPASNGYLQVQVALGHQRRIPKTIHVLIATAFHGPKPTPAHQVRHLDGTRTNNRPENLAWGTPAENSADRKAHGRQFYPPWDDPAYRASQISAMKQAIARKRGGA